MKGRVLHFSVQASEGIITGDDGGRYKFSGADWRDDLAPVRGLAVDFDVRDGRAVEVFRALGPAPLPASTPPRSKSRVSAGLFGILLGGVGAHKFYTGAWAWGLIYLAFCWTYVPAVVGLVEGIRYLTFSDEEFEYKTLANPGPFAWVW